MVRVVSFNESAETFSLHEADLSEWFEKPDPPELDDPKEFPEEQPWIPRKVSLGKRTKPVH